MKDLISREAAICIASGYCHPADIAKELAKLPAAQPLTDEDYIELHDRFGTWVEEVVRDMISGEGKRWGQERKT